MRAMNGPTRRFRVGQVLLLSLLVTLALGAVSSTPVTGTVGDRPTFRATVPTPDAGVVQLIERAQSADYWVRIQTGQDVTYFKGSESCPSCDQANEAEFFQRPQLIVDGEMVWMRLAAESWTLNFRPSADSADTYELFVAPRQPNTELTDEILTQVDEALAPFEVLPGDATSLDFAAYNPPSDPGPPQGVAMTPALYGFLQASDWTVAASERGVARSGLRAVVDVELSSGSAELPSDLDLVVESRSGDTARVQALIPQLDDLARASSVQNVQ